METERSHLACAILTLVEGHKDTGFPVRGCHRGPICKVGINSTVQLLIGNCKMARLKFHFIIKYNLSLLRAERVLM